MQQPNGLQKDSLASSSASSSSSKIWSPLEGSSLSHSRLNLDKFSPVLPLPPPGEPSGNSASGAQPGRMEEWACKIVLVGDSRTGKSSLIHRFISDTFVEFHTPTSFEKYTFTYEMSESRINFTIWDTSGAVAYDTVRPLAYQDAKVFLLCFQIGDPDTLDNTVNKWYPEVKQQCSTAPLILCGCQSDLRADADAMAQLAKFQRTPVTSEQALAISRHIGAITYVESSAKASVRSVRETFEVAALAAFGRLNKNHFLGGTTLHRHRSFLKLKNKQDLKHELRGKARNCAIM